MLRQFVIAILMLAAAGMVRAGEAAHVVFVEGKVQIAAHSISVSDAVNEGDQIETGVDGYIYMKTVDGGFLILRPNTRARIVAYHIDQQNPANTRVKLELLNGVARSISGAGVKQAKQNFRFNTPVAAIGVRGTDFTVYTDQEVSRVTVISGGVIVSGFGGSCLSDGGGPCEGANSKELFADKVGQLLQIQKGQVSPQLLRSNGISPDINAPPRSDENSKTSSISNTGPAVFSLDPQKSSNLNAVGVAPPAPPIVTPPPVVTPPAVVIPPPVVVVPPSPPEILWGRWQAIASLPADSAALAKLGSGAYVAGYDIGPFFISRVNNSQLVLPSSGQATFALQSSEAYIVVNGQAPVAATVQNPQLSVNFASGTFATSLTLSSPGQQVPVDVQGYVTNKGVLVNNTYSNFSLQGYLGGAGAQQAGYIFQSLNAPPVAVFGATSWGR